MATITKGKTFGATDTVENTDLHALVDSATISGITDADIAGSKFLVNAQATEPAAVTAGKPWIDTSASPPALKIANGTAYVSPATQISFSYAFNTLMQLWGAGTSAAATGWTLAGASATAARTTTSTHYKYGAEAVQVTRAGADATYYQDVDLIADFGPVGAWLSKAVSLGAWVRATVASRVRIYIDDGVTTTYSSYHTGGGDLEFLTVDKTLSASASRVRIGLSVDTGDTSAQFGSVVFIQGTGVTEFIPSGWRGRKCVLFLDTGNANHSGSPDYFGASERGTQVAANTRVPFKGVARNAQFSSSVVPGGSDTYVYVLQKEGSDTDITATTTSAATESQDNSNHVAFAKGDLIVVKITTSGTAAHHRCALEYEEVP